MPALIPAVGIAETAAPTEFQRAKCERYARAYGDVVRRFGTNGVSAEFLAAHARFIDGHCLARADVCPRGAAELNLANLLVMAGMNQGLSSTFFPFACRKDGAFRALPPLPAELPLDMAGEFGHRPIIHPAA